MRSLRNVLCCVLGAFTFSPRPNWTQWKRQKYFTLLFSYWLGEKRFNIQLKHIFIVEFVYLWIRCTLQIHMWNWNLLKNSFNVQLSDYHVCVHCMIFLPIAFNFLPNLRNNQKPTVLVVNQNNWIHPSIAKKKQNLIHNWFNRTHYWNSV